MRSILKMACKPKLYPVRLGKWLLFIHLIFWTSTITSQSNQAFSFPDPMETDYETKPWTRWWWHGSNVTKEGIKMELEQMKAVGIGGVEITPIYGVIGEEAEFVDFLSKEWLDLLEYTLEEAERLGMGVDMATGTGWPFGGPWIFKDNASKYLAYKIFKVAEGDLLDERIVNQQQPIFRQVKNQAVDFYRFSETSGIPMSKLNMPLVNQFIPPATIEDIAYPLNMNKDMQRLAIDQIRFEESLPLIKVNAYGESGQVIQLTDSLGMDSILKWKVPSGNWTVVAIFQGYHGKMVERAAPGGEGLVIDHFSMEAITAYLKWFQNSFQGRKLEYLRAFFNDSYEVDDAIGQSNWTPRFFEYFNDKKGYDLENYLPALLDKEFENPEIAKAVLTDYREVASNLLLENFTNPWSEWSHNLGAIVRNQSHGSPGNILDLYAASDIPEAEGTQNLRIKFASSAANVAGKKLVSAEAATWLNEHFTSGLSNLKSNLDNYFLNGVNHIVYHGTAYSPQEDLWPGRLFYAAVHMNNRNPLWAHTVTLNHYVTRIQSTLQHASPDQDFLIYFPAYDQFAAESEELLVHFDGHGPQVDNTAFGQLSKELLEQGYAFDYISDMQIQSLMYDNQILSSGNQYKAIVVPETEFMPLATLEKLHHLSEQGGKILFHKSLPLKSPGLDIHGDVEAGYVALKKDLAKPSSVIFIGEDVTAMLSRIGIKREEMVGNGLRYLRKKEDGAKVYFINNANNAAFEGWITINGVYENVVISDPMTGKEGLAKSRVEDDETYVYLQMSRESSYILHTSNDFIDLEVWNYIGQKGESVNLDGEWKVIFTEGGPQLPESLEMEHLDWWTSSENSEYRHFSGIAAYSTTFELQDTTSPFWILDLGQVESSAKVKLNGEEIATLIGPDYSILLPRRYFGKVNQLEIEVANKMMNRIIYMEQEKVFWKRFYNINMSAKFRENYGAMGVFDASKMNPVPSGLKGPVMLIPLKVLH